jgi:hypothetical protein
MVVVLRGSGVSPPTSTMVGFGGVVPWKLERGCMLCCVRMEEEPPGAMVADGDDKPGERFRFGLTPWRWVHGERGGGDI